MANGPCALISPTMSLHLADQHHADDVHGLGGGDPVAGGEDRLDAEPVQVGRDLRSTAVHHDGPQPHIPQEDDVLGEGPLQGLVGHRVAAVLDDHAAPMEPLEPGQRLDQESRLLQGDVMTAGHRAHRHVEYAEFSWT